MATELYTNIYFDTLNNGKYIFVDGTYFLESY